MPYRLPSDVRVGVGDHGVERYLDRVDPDAREEEIPEIVEMMVRTAWFFDVDEAMWTFRGVRIEHSEDETLIAYNSIADVLFILDVQSPTLVFVKTIARTRRGKHGQKWADYTIIRAKPHAANGVAANGR